MLGCIYAKSSETRILKLRYLLRINFTLAQISQKNEQNLSVSEDRNVLLN